MIPIPIGDTTKTRHTAWINWLLIAANVIVFFWIRTSPAFDTERVISYALVPDTWQANWKTLFTSMFLHADLLHLGGNMLFLYIAGDNVEDRIGHLQYLVFYLLAGLAGSAVHIWYAMHFGGSSTPTIGASGAISGVMGAYLILFPKSNIKFMLWIIIFVRFFTLPAWGVLGFWVGSQILMARNQWHGVAEKEAAMVAVFAHLGGFAFGALVGLGVRLFGKAPKKGHD
jgi:membrane associated rhomboid family serine protease